MQNYSEMSPETLRYHSLVQFKLLREGAVPPTRGTDFSGAFDIYAPEAGIIPAKSSLTIPTGLAHRVHPGYTIEMRVEVGNTHRVVQVPFSLQGLLFGRSGLAAKLGIRPFFAPCLIDHDYRGEIALTLENTTAEDFTWKAGDRLCQMMYLPTYMGPICTTEELDETSRGTGGHGSTGGVSHG